MVASISQNFGGSKAADEARAFPHNGFRVHELRYNKKGMPLGKESDHSLLYPSMIICVGLIS